MIYTNPKEGKAMETKSMKEVYKGIAMALTSMNNCTASGNQEWHDKHEETIEELVKNYMPSGSGFDNGTSFDWIKSSANKLVFHTAYHHMNENGCYDGWTDHTITVTPDLAMDINIKVSGSNRNNIKDYMYDILS
jgi:hypothetical protein